MCPGGKSLRALRMAWYLSSGNGSKCGANVLYTHSAVLLLISRSMVTANHMHSSSCEHGRRRAFTRCKFMEASKKPETAPLKNRWKQVLGSCSDGCPVRAAWLRIFMLLVRNSSLSNTSVTCSFDKILSIRDVSKTCILAPRSGLFHAVPGNPQRMRSPRRFLKLGGHCARSN